MMDESDQALPEYNEFEARLHELGSSLAGSECHGMICAGLSRSQASDSGGLSPAILGEETETLVQDPVMAKMLASLMLLSAAWLEQGSYEFRLFLPDDSDSLTDRSLAVADWCRGYIMGMVEAGLTDFDTLPDDAAEVLRDLVAISELEAPADDEAAEEDLMQVEEFIRVGVQVVYENLNNPARGHMSYYARRRAEVMQLMGDGVAIIPTAGECLRNGDVHYPFRAASDFYYLTHFPEPEAVAVLIPGREHGEYVLFCRERDPEKEIWDGRRAGLEGACDQYKADDAFPYSDIDEILPGLLENRDKVFYCMGANPGFDNRLMTWVNEVRSKSRAGISAPAEILDLGHILHEMRLVKRSEEKALMKKACKVSARAHLRAMQECRPGMNEYEIESIFLHEFRRAGSESTAYPSIVAGGENACILHYTGNNAELHDGDLLLIDAGCEMDGYASDISRTFPINGRFSAEQRALYDVVLAAQLAAIETIKPGASWNDPHDAAVRVLTEGLVEHGLLNGKVDDLIESGDYRRFYMHRTGHWLGMDVHDVGDYKVDNNWRELEAGMVLTVEPGLYVSAGARDVDERWWNIGIRIEDDVAVTAKGCDVLSSDAPKYADDIEQVMA